MFDLGGAANELIGGYSHGMRQECALAAALLHEPRVLCLDEPTVGLDPLSARLIKDVLRGLTARGATVFLTTHILEIAESLCDEIGVLQAGKIIASGTVGELRAQAHAGEDNTLEDIFLALTSAGRDREHAAHLTERQ